MVLIFHEALIYDTTLDTTICTYILSTANLLEAMSNERLEYDKE